MKKAMVNFSDFHPITRDNSDVLLKIIDEVHPDIVHVQFEHGLYGIVLDPLNPNKTTTNIDSFYEMCTVPIVTTFHSAYSFKEWMSLVPLDREVGWTGKVGVLAGILKAYWEHFLNYRSFHNLNKEQIEKKSGRYSVFTTPVIFDRGWRSDISWCLSLLYPLVPPKMKHEQNSLCRKKAG